MTTYAKTDFYAQVTNTVIEMMESGIFSAKNEWTKTQVNAFNSCNAVTKRRYSGINTIVLACAMLKNGFVSNEWLTFKQALENNTPVKKGSKSQTVFFYKTLKKENDKNEIEKIPMLKSFNVFNVEQLENYTAPVVEVTTESEFLMMEKAEEIMTKSGAKFNFGGDSAFFRPSTDSITLPTREQFSDEAFFYSVAFHELTHWTGAKTRLDRQNGKRFGDAAYAMEELVAELGATFLCADIDILPRTLDNHASYLANWIQVLKDDKKAIFTAAAQAQKAHDFIMSLVNPAAKEEAEPMAKAG
jgi:antirestriction protein ArdC